MNGTTIVLLVALICILIILVTKWCSKIENFAGNDGYYQITWDAPVNTGGSPIDKYSITIKDGDDVIVQDDVTETEYDFGKDDVNVGKWNTDYSVSITATNKGGDTSEPTSYSFTSATGPIAFNNVLYVSGDKSQPLSVDSQINYDTIVTFTLYPDVKFSSDNVKTGDIYLVRGGDVVCSSKINSIGNPASNEIKLFFNKFNCDGITSFKEGDLVYFTLSYEYDQIVLMYKDEGKTLQSKNPEPVKNINAKYISN